METEHSNKESVGEEATPVFRSPWPSSEPVSELLTNAVKVAAVLAVLLGIGFSVISGLENRLIDRMDISNRVLSAQLNRELSAQVHGLQRSIRGLERSVAAGFKQAHQRTDRIEGHMGERMDRIESDIDQIEADVDAIEKHLLLIGSAIDSEAVPVTNVPAVATPGRHLSTASDIGSFNPTATPGPGER